MQFTSQHKEKGQNNSKLAVRDFIFKGRSGCGGSTTLLGGRLCKVALKSVPTPVNFRRVNPLPGALTQRAVCHANRA